MKWVKVSQILKLDFKAKLGIELPCRGIRIGPGLQFSLLYIHKTLSYRRSHKYAVVYNKRFTHCPGASSLLACIRRTTHIGPPLKQVKNLPFSNYKFVSFKTNNLAYPAANLVVHLLSFTINPLLYENLDSNGYVRGLEYSFGDLSKVFSLSQFFASTTLVLKSSES